MYFLTIILLAPGILAALTVHEFSHGWVAYRLGDPTAKAAGRLTLNPLAHLDPIGTIMLFIVHFGWAKPVPVNPYYFQKPRQGMVWVSLAGPASNIIFAAVLGILFRILLAAGMMSLNGFFANLIAFAIFINLMLAFFNLIPIPPLDGSKIVGGLLPDRYIEAWDWFERRGFLFLIGLIIIGQMTGGSIFGRTILPLSEWFYQLFTGHRILL